MERRSYRRYGQRPSVWRDWERMRREMNRLFDQPAWARWNAAPSYPAMNVWTSEEGAMVTAELPGCNPENFDISVVGDTLTIKGERTEQELPEGTRYHRRERSCGSFSRTFTLPYQVNPDKVEATFEQGVLRVTLPRSEEDKPKRIQVKAE